MDRFLLVLFFVVEVDINQGLVLCPKVIDYERTTIYI